MQGKWTYRSIRNIVGLAAQTDDSVTPLVLFEGVLDLATEADGAVTGAFGMADGSALTVRGSQRGDAPSEPELVLEGIARGSTAGWRWVLRGTVSRVGDGADGSMLFAGTVRHEGTEPVDDVDRTAAFTAFKHPEHPPPRTERANALVRDM